MSILRLEVQKQPFADVRKELCNIRRKSSLLESLGGLQLYYKETPTQVFSCEYCTICINSFFI